MEKNDSGEVKAIIESYPADERFALAIMQDIQGKQQYISQESMEMIADYIGTPLSRLYAMATFYRALKLQPRGRYVIKACDGTACHIKGSSQALDCIKRVLGIRPGETTADGLFSLETVNCMGACAFAPVMSINDKTYAKLTDEKIARIVAQYKEGGEADD